MRVWICFQLSFFILAKQLKSWSPDCMCHLQNVALWGSTSPDVTQQMLMLEEYKLGIWPLLCYALLCVVTVPPGGQKVTLHGDAPLLWMQRLGWGFSQAGEQTVSVSPSSSNCCGELTPLIPHDIPRQPARVSPEVMARLCVTGTVGDECVSIS